MYSYSKELLPNGLLVVNVEIPHIHIAEVVLYLRCGSRFETTENNGISHCLEHLLLRGSKNYPSTKDLHRAFENIGGELNGATSGEYLYLCYSHHPDFFREGMSAFSDIIKNPTFNELDIEKKVIIEEILSEQNTKGEIVDIDTVACSLLWPNNSLGFSTLGPQKNIDFFNVEQLKKHFKDFFNPNNMVLCCSGNIDKKTVLDSVYAAFGDLSGGSKKLLDKVDCSQETFEVTFVESSEPKADVQICFRGISYNDPGFFPAVLLKRVFSDSVGSRLNYAIREKEGLVYDISANVSAFFDTGTFDIDFSVVNENLELTISAVFKEVYKLLKAGVSDEELAFAKKQHLFALDYSVDSTFKMCVRFGWSELFSTPLTPEEEKEIIKKISLEALESIARHMFRPENLNIVVVGLVSEKQKVGIDALARSFCSDVEKLAL